MRWEIDLILKESLEIFNKEDKQAASLFLNWFKQLSEHQKIDQSDYEKLEHVYKNAEEVNTMLITALKKERKQLIDLGKEQGIEQGKIEDAIKMLTKGMSVSFICEITGFSEEIILKLKSSNNIQN